MTLLVFAMVQVVPRLAPRFGNTPLLAAGLLVAVAGMTWLSQIGATTAYFPGIAIPLLLSASGSGSRSRR